MSPTALAVLCDYPEEGWPSMDLCAEMLLSRLQSEQTQRVRPIRLCPPFRRRLARLPLAKRNSWSANVDRLLNRFWDYPRFVRRQSRGFDAFHLCDHSYAQLLHALPANRTGVVCHDLDTFRCLLEPSGEPRPMWFRSMARRILNGLQKAAIVFHVSHLTRRLIEKYDLIDPAKLVYAPNGVAPDFTADEETECPVSLPISGDGPFILHIGSCIQRKRVEVLLDVFAGVKATHPDTRLVQVGGTWTDSQRQQIARLGLGSAIQQVRGLARKEVAQLYRGAALVLQPSEAEGFGLPIVEALACGSIVVASDIPVLHEVGGEAAVYCPVADVAAWVQTACRLLAQPDAAPSRSLRLVHARRYSWSAQAETILTAYERLLRCA